MKILCSTLLLLCSIMSFSQTEKQTNSNVTNIALTTSTSDAQAMQMFLKAEKLFVKGAYKKAAVLYKQAYNVDTTFIDALDNLALSYRRLYEMDSAIYFYKLSLSKLPNNEGVLNNLGLVYTYLEKYDDAIQTFETLLKYYPNHAEGMYSIALVYLLSEKYDKAIEYSSKSFDLSKENDKLLAADAVYIVCKSYISTDKKTEAHNYYKKAKASGIQCSDAADEFGF